MLVHFVLYPFCCIPHLVSNTKNLLSGERDIPEEILKDLESSLSCNHTFAVFCSFLSNFPIKRPIQSIVKNIAIDLLVEDLWESIEITMLFSSATFSIV